MLTKKELEVLKLRQKKMTQVEVAEQLGITQAAVSKFEKNALEKIKKAYKAVALAKKLGLEVDEDEL